MNRLASSSSESSQRAESRSAGPASALEDAPQAVPFLAARQHWLAVALLILHAALAWPLRVVSITTRIDDATYILLARSLLHFGYNDTFLVGSPFHSQYPPGFPALLAGLIAVAGERLDLFAAVNIALSAVSLGLFYDMARRRWPANVALLALAAAAVNPFLIFTAGRIASEPLFMALAMLALWSLSRTPASPRLLALGGAAVLACALVRTIGVTFIAAAALYWILERRVRHVLVLTGVVAATVGAWLLWTVRAPQLGARSYVADFSYQMAGSRSAVVEMAFRVVDNLKEYFAHALPWIVWPAIPGTVFDNALWLLLNVTLGVVGAWQLWRRHRIVAIALASYCGLLAIWTWAVTRFLFPILPLIFLAFFAGASWLALALRARLFRPLPFLLGAVIILTGLSRNALSIDLALACERDQPLTSPGCFDPDQRSVFAAAAFAKRELSPSTVIVAARDAPFGYLSGLQTYPFPSIRRADSSRFLPFLLDAGIQYVLLGLSVERDEATTAPKLYAICRNLELVAHFPPRTNLFRVHPTAAPDSGAAACVAIRRYQASSKYVFPRSGQFEF